MILIVLDGVGVGALPDAGEYGDSGCNTLAHVADSVGGLTLPNLEALGLGHIGSFKGVRLMGQPTGCFGKMGFLTQGKDSTVGHWELAGLTVDTPFPVYPSGFPHEVIDAFERVIGRRTLGNRVASGTKIIHELGEQHLKTGFPIVYTSVDSVFQIAAHEKVIPLEDLYKICREARKLLKPPHQVARVIARPFIGGPGAFVRTDHRRDFAIEPPGTTLLDSLNRGGQLVMGIGKIDDLFKSRGLTRSTHAGSNPAAMDELHHLIAKVPRGLLFVNLNDFDTLYGHRNDTAGFAGALQEFDRRLSRIIEQLRPGDVLFITADHGNDPTTPGTDHSREYVPLLVTGPKLAQGVNLGTRQTAADLGQTIAEALGAARLAWGDSFLQALSPG
ncbi:MAG: phosphopentomutase [Nitrospiraceae bacterium]